MKKNPCLALALFALLLPLAVPADDLTPPTVTWNAPGEGSCWQIDAAHPELGLVVSAEDPSGVKQGQIWMKKGRFGVTAAFPRLAQPLGPHLCPRRRGPALGTRDAHDPHARL